MIETGENWWWITRTNVHHTSGPTRVIVNEEEDPNFKSRPVGFMAKFDEEEDVD